MRKFIVLAVLCVAGLISSTSEASAFGWRKKKNDCAPAVVATPVVSQSACGCGGAMPSSFPVSSGYYGGGYAPSYYGGSPYSSSMGYWNSPSPYYGGMGGYRIYR